MKKNFHLVIYKLAFIFRFIRSNLKFIILSIGIIGLICNSNAQPGTWTWMKGDSNAYAVPVYGIKGVPDTANTPASMRDAAGWTDPQGNLWLFGGWRDLANEYNTLWKYNI